MVWGTPVSCQTNALQKKMYMQNNAGVLGCPKKLNPVWKGIWVENKIMSAVLLEITNNKKVYGDSDHPRCLERLRGQIKERGEPKKVREGIQMLGVGKERVSSVVLLGKRL